MANGTQYSFQRIEKKYFISPAQAETMLGEMRQHMTVDRYGEYAIGNIYCDTDNFRLIRASLEKPAYKEKLRIRCYGVPLSAYPNPTLCGERYSFKPKDTPYLNR